MRTVDDFADIRQAHRDGLSIRRDRQAARRRTGHRPQGPATTPSRKPTPWPSRGPPPSSGRSATSSTPSSPPTSSAPPKQRHTATQIFRRLRRRARLRRQLRPGPPLPARPGGSTGARRSSRWTTRRAIGPRPTSATSTSTSPTAAGRFRSCSSPGATPTAPFALALPTERTEADPARPGRGVRLLRLRAARAVVGQPQTVAIHLFRGRERTLHPRYAALASHYTFTPKFCLPATGNEKPRVENRVFDLQRQWATPVPRVADLAELNAHLLPLLPGRARPDQRRQRRDGRRALRAGPGAPPCRCRPPVRRLRVPDRPGGQVPDGAVRRQRLQRAAPLGVPAVTVKGYVDRVEVVADGQVVARHARSYGHGRTRARPAAFPGGAGTQAGGPGPRPGLPRLATAAGVRRPAPRPGSPTRHAGRRPAVHPRAATARPPPAGPGRAGDRVVPASAAARTPPPSPTRRSDSRRSDATAPCRLVTTGMSPQADALVACRVPAARPVPVRPFTIPVLKEETMPMTATDGPAAAGQPEAAQAADHAGRVREAGP